MEDVWKLTEATLRQQCRVTGVIEPATRLREDLGLDSLALLTLAVAAEDHFRLCLNEDPESPPSTVGDFVELVEKRLAEGRPHA
ncbi:MAG: acyl carrier protein [Candidatus Eremiobacteraeota bacterium]|nr:acyl carrier protein [Candidatus Eremiobacteraeota bacterium]